jgi:hypothetical protein
MTRPGDYFVSLDLTDGYYTLGIREEDRDYFTVKIVIEIVYNNTRINRTLSLGPPCYAKSGLISLG